MITIIFNFKVHFTFPYDKYFTSFYNRIWKETCELQEHGSGKYRFKGELRCLYKNESWKNKQDSKRNSTFITALNLR